MRIAYNVIEDTTSSVVTERIHLLDYWQITGMSQEGKKKDSFRSGYSLSLLFYVTSLQIFLIRAKQSVGKI